MRDNENPHQEEWTKVKKNRLHERQRLIRSSVESTSRDCDGKDSQLGHEMKELIVCEIVENKRNKYITCSAIFT